MKNSVLILIALAVIFSAHSYCQQATGEVGAQTPVATPEAPKAAPPAAPAVKAPTHQVTSIKFRDVPDDHWAASSVYDLVNLGVTQGYPDGTYRGNNYITRYETAQFLSKLAAAIGDTGDRVDIEVEKLKEELRAEIRSLRADIAELKRIPEEGEEKPVTGSFSSRIIFGNLVATNTSVEGQAAPVGPLVRYRLKMNFARSVGEGAKVKINLDTMDSGFGGGSSDLSMRILDVEGDLRMNMGLENPVDVKVTSGPGPVSHTEEADVNGNYIARSENGTVYLRPWNSIMFSSRMFGLDTGLGYIARNLSAFGEVEVNQIKTVIGYSFPGIFFIPSFKLNTNVDYLSSRPQSDPPGPTDTKVTLDTSLYSTTKHRLNLIYGFGQGTSPHNSMFGFEAYFLDMWDSGTTFVLKYRKVGSEYLYENADLHEDLFAGLDVFNRYIGDGDGLGVVDVGGDLTQVITETLRLVGKADWRLGPDNAYGEDLPQCSLVIEAGVNWDIATDALFEFLYRVESIPSAADISSDLTQLGLSFKF